MTPFRRRLLMQKHGPSERLVYELAEWDFHNGTLDIRNYFGGVIGKTYRFVWDWTLKASTASATLYRVQCGRMSFVEGAVFAPTHTTNSIDVTEHCDNLRTTSNTNTFAQIGGFNNASAEIDKITNIKIYEVS